MFAYDILVKILSFRSDVNENVSRYVENEYVSKIGFRITSTKNVTWLVFFRKNLTWESSMTSTRFLI